MAHLRKTERDFPILYHTTIGAAFKELGFNDM
jgi:hypothetical protein